MSINRRYADIDSPRPKPLAPKPAAEQQVKPSADTAPATKRKPGRPLAKDKANTLAATKPWLAEGISERLWYYRQARARAKQ